MSIAIAVLASVSAWMAWPAAPPTIAVLPFQNLTPSADNDALVEGLTHEVVAGLSRIEGWRVQPLGAAVAGDDGEARDAARRIGAAFVLTASVVASTGRLRLNTRLVNVRSGTTEWARTFDSGGGDVFAILDEMALSLVNQLRLDVVGGQRRVARLLGRLGE